MTPWSGALSVLLSATPFVSVVDQFSIELPKAPVIVDDDGSVVLSVHAPARHRVYVLEGPRADRDSVEVAIDLPEDTLRARQASVRELAAAGRPVLQERAVSAGKVAGREYRIREPSGVRTLRIFLLEERTVRVSCAGFTECAAILDSFRLVTPAPAAGRR